jgi:hypothetical protein
MVERFNRTLRTKIDKYLKLNKTKTWYKVLPDLLKNYSKHSTINMAPNNVTTTKDVAKIRFKAFERGNEARKETNDFEVGDSVNIKKQKSL